MNKLFIILTLIVLFTSCNTTNNNKTQEEYSIDSLSYAQPKSAVIKSMDLRVKVHFQKKELEGMVTYLINSNNTDRIIFDTKNLVIERVLIGANFQKTAYMHDASDSIKGRALIIQIKPTTKKVRIYYRTKPNSKEIVWYKQENSNSNQVLINQKSSFARSWIPIQDSPKIKIYYIASIETSKKMNVKMNTLSSKENLLGIHNFNSKNAIKANSISLLIEN